MAVLTNGEVQKAFGDAELYLEGVLRGQDPTENPIIGVVHALIRSIRIYSSSGNEIPGYRGLGLIEMLELAQSVLETKPTSDRHLSINSYKAIALSLAVGSRS